LIQKVTSTLGEEVGLPIIKANVVMEIMSTLRILNKFKLLQIREQSKYLLVVSILLLSVMIMNCMLGVLALTENVDLETFKRQTNLD
jgi:hypothetical protein